MKFHNFLQDLVIYFHCKHFLCHLLCEFLYYRQSRWQLWWLFCSEWPNKEFRIFRPGSLWSNRFLILSKKSWLARSCLVSNGRACWNYNSRRTCWHVPLQHTCSWLAKWTSSSYSWRNYKWQSLLQLLWQYLPLWNPNSNQALHQLLFVLFGGCTCLLVKILFNQHHINR